MLFAQQRDQVMGKWTKGLDHVVVIVLDEIKLRTEGDSDFLKSIIMENSVHVTGKYVDEQTVTFASLEDNRRKF